MKRKYTEEEVRERMFMRIYCNPDDLNIFVKRRGICSYTMNLGNPWSWIITGAAVLLVLAMVRLFA